MAQGLHLLDRGAVYRIALIHIRDLVIAIKRARGGGQAVRLCHCLAWCLHSTGGACFAGISLVSEHAFHDSQRGPAHSPVLTPAVTIAGLLVAAG